VGLRRRGLAADGLSALRGGFYAWGLRVSELVSLPLSAAGVAEGLIAVRGKGGKERLVPLNDRARTAFRRWIDLCGEAGRPLRGDSRGLRSGDGPRRTYSPGLPMLRTLPSSDTSAGCTCR